MHVPANAGKRHFVVEGLGGFDALLATFAPASLLRRVVAVKLMRAWGEHPQERSFWSAVCGPKREFPPGSLTFMLHGYLVEITDSRGGTRTIPREPPKN